MKKWIFKNNQWQEWSPPASKGMFLNNETWEAYARGEWTTASIFYLTVEQEEMPTEVSA